MNRNRTAGSILVAVLLATSWSEARADEDAEEGCIGTSPMSDIVCSEPELRELDHEIQTLIFEHKSATGDFLNFVGFDYWLDLTQRSCGGQSDTISCLRAAYLGKIAELQNDIDEARALDPATSDTLPLSPESP